jgi:hypothetical protein
LLPLSIALTAGLAGADSGAPPISHEVVVDVVKIEGTVWSGSDSLDQTCTFRHLKGGILNYTTPSGTFQNGTWKQHGSNVYVEMNGKCAEYRGVLQGECIAGQAGNIRGLRWSWRVKRTKEIAK